MLVDCPTQLILYLYLSNVKEHSREICYICTGVTSMSGLFFSMSVLIKSSVVTVVFTLISKYCNSTILHSSHSCFAKVQPHALVLFSEGNAVVAIVSGFYSNFNLPPVPRLLKPETL